MHGHLVGGGGTGALALLLDHVLQTRSGLPDVGVLLVLLKELLAGGFCSLLGFRLEVAQIVLNHFLCLLDAHGGFGSVEYRLHAILEIIDAEFFHSHSLQLASHGETPGVT